MRRWMVAGVVAGLTTAVVFAQHDARPPDHIDRFAGEVIVRAGVSGGMHYAGAYCNPGFMAVCSCNGTSSAVCACLQC